MLESALPSISNFLEESTGLPQTARCGPRMEDDLDQEEAVGDESPLGNNPINW